MIKVQVIGLERTKARLNRIPANIRQALLDTMNGIGMMLERKVKKEKLTGQVLRVRSGRLRSSVHSSTTATGSNVTTTVGTNVIYAARHEYGFTGTETVRAHLRVIKEAFGKPISPTQVRVGQFSRKVNAKERSFLRATLEENRSEIHKRIASAVRSGARKGD